MMSTRVLMTPALVIAALIVAGCREGDRPIGGRGTPSSLTEKSHASNPLNIARTEGKPRVATRLSPAPRQLGR